MIAVTGRKLAKPYYERVADLLVDTLVAAGVERIYGLAGDSLNGITDSIRPRDNIKWVPVRHEETAAFAAGAEAHLTGRLAVCAGSCGPGNLHLINGLYDAHRSRVPVLAIAAQIPSGEIGSTYFQETHPEHLFAQCSHYCELISQPEQMPRVLEIAMQTAIARRGVSVIALPGDIALKHAVTTEPRLHFPPPKPKVCPADDEIEKLAKILNQSDKITILAGAGCAGAHAELVSLAGKLNAPIVHAMRGKEFVEYDNPFDVGMTGLLGFSSDSLDFVELEMKAGGFLDFAVELKNPDFAALGESAGILGLKAETAQDVRPMLQKAFKHDGPALVEVLVHRQELSMPPTITIEQASGFGMFMLKAVISGRGDELVDLAKVNLFR